MENKNKEVFETSNLYFVASAVIDGGFRIVSTLHPVQLTNFSHFEITPKSKAASLYEDYQMDRIQISPRLIQTCITRLRKMRIGQVLEPIKKNEETK